MFLCAGGVAGRRWRGDAAKERGESGEAGAEERRSLRRKGRHREGVEQRGRAGDEEEQPMVDHEMGTLMKATRRVLP